MNLVSREINVKEYLFTLDSPENKDEHTYLTSSIEYVLAKINKGITNKILFEDKCLKRLDYYFSNGVVEIKQLSGGSKVFINFLLYDDTLDITLVETVLLRDERFKITNVSIIDRGD